MEYEWGHNMINRLVLVII